MALVYDLIFPRDISYQHTTNILPTNQGCHLALFETVCQKCNGLKKYFFRPVLAIFNQKHEVFN
jgi:hypothetical protein